MLLSTLGMASSVYNAIQMYLLYLLYYICFTKENVYITTFPFLWYFKINLMLAFFLIWFSQLCIPLISMGLCASPTVWQSYRNVFFLGNMPHRSHSLEILEDLLLHSLEHSHLKFPEDLLKVLLKGGLKISPKKCQLVRTKWQYMGNTIFIKRKVCIKP